MEQTFTDALRCARLIDLQDGSALGLPDTQGLVAVGLTVDDRLSFTYDDQEDGDDLVLTLCHVQRREDGHWFVPSAFLPCFLNEAVAEEESLLSQGSTVRLGDRELRYSIPLESRLRLASETRRQGGPPPKPRRTSVNLEDTPGLRRAMSTIQEEKTVTESDESSDKELVQHLSTPEEMAQLACSYVCHQVALYTDLLLSAEELDFLFKAILASGETCETQMKEFVTRYTEDQEKAVKTGGDVGPLHEPVIFLLTDLLKANLDSVDNATLWIKLLATFANFSPNLAFLIDHKVAPVVLGAMAVHGRAPQLQQYACTVLTQLATYAPPVGQKGPVREGGVDLVTYVLTNHVHDTLVLRPALRTLANLTHTYSAVANEALSLGSYTADLADLAQTVVLQEVERSMGILDFIEEHALPVVMETMEHHLRDLAIQTEGRRLLAFFVDEEIKATRKKSLNKLSNCRVRFQLDPNDPTSIVSTDHDSVDTSDDDDDGQRRLSTISDDSTVGTYRRPHQAGDPLTGRGADHLGAGKREEEGVYAEIPELDGWEQGPHLSLPRPVTSPGHAQEQPEEGAPRLRKVGVVGGAAVADAGGELSVCEFEPWDDLGPVIGTGAALGLQLGATGDDGLYDEDESNPGLKFALDKGMEDLPLDASKYGGKSLLDELSEIKVEQFEDSNENTVDELPRRQQSNIDIMAMSTNEPENDSGMVSERELDIENETSIHLIKEVVPGADIPSDKEKGNSLKRGVKKMGRAMDKALRSGKNRMFNKMRQRLKFKELRTKEGQLMESSKGVGDTVERVKDAIGDDVPDLSTLLKNGDSFGAGELRSGLIIHGATTDWSVTEDVPDSDTELQATTTELCPDRETPPGSPQEKAPPLFLPPIAPKVKGSQNTVGKLINIWKRKESQESKETVREDKVTERKHWRPFEQMSNILSNGKQTTQLPTQKSAKEPFSQEDATDAAKGEPQKDIAIMNQPDTAETSPPSDGDQTSSDMMYQEYMRRNSRRRTLGSLALLPDMERFVASSRASLTDAVEVATWASSYNAFSGEDVQDMDQDAIHQVRVSRTKWKSVMAEMKKRVKNETLPFKLKTGDRDEAAPRSTSDVPVIQYSAGCETTAGLQDQGSLSGVVKVAHSAINDLVRRPSAHRFTTDSPDVSGRSFSELHNTEWYDSNVLAAKALITEHVVGVWQGGPSRVVGTLGQRAADLLVVCGAAPALVASVRVGFTLDQPLTKAHPSFTSALMDMLTGLPSGDEARLDTLESLLLLLGPAGHPYHQQVAARCGRALLADALPSLTSTPAGTALLQELLECAERRLVDSSTTLVFQKEALVAFVDRLKMLLNQEVWL